MVGGGGQGLRRGVGVRGARGLRWARTGASLHREPAFNGARHADSRRDPSPARRAGRAVRRVSAAEPLFLRACRREPVERTPVWFMRQAGRSLPEYRGLRERWSLEEIVAQPDLCAEVTLQPVHRLGVDAAAMVADIILPLRRVGIDFELADSVGPVIANPILSAEAVRSLRTPPAAASVPQVLDAVRIVARESPVPVICFAGGPFTLASYAIEGKPSRDFVLTKQLMYRAPEAFALLLGKLASVMAEYLDAQLP